MTGLTIQGIGHAVPPYILTNEQLSHMVETNDQWIQTRTGIKERRLLKDGTLLSICHEAAGKAMEQAGITAEEIGLCIVATISSDTATPSMACLLHEALGLSEDTPAFDLSAGCSGFLYALETAAAMLPRQSRPYALVVGGEKLSRMTDFTDRSTCILFGDGAGAAIVRQSDSPFHCRLFAKGNKDILYAGGVNEETPSYLHMDGQAVFKFAIETVPKAAKELLQASDFPMEKVDWFVLHQANHRIVESIAKRLKVPMERFYENMDRYGNTSAASIPIALSEMAEKGLLKEGQWVLCLGFGAGLTWGGALFPWKGERT